MRVLLVEDDAAIAELVTWHFKREDYEVKHTPDGTRMRLTSSFASAEQMEQLVAMGTHTGKAIAPVLAR